MSSGPTIVIDPTDIVTWEDAVKLWNFARQANIISGSDYAAPSTPEGYQQLLSLVQTWLANHSGGALTWGNSILPKVAQDTNLITAVQATDPANVGTLSGQPLTDIVTTGGIAGSTAATVGAGSYGLVKKAIAVVTATSLLATTIFAAQLSEADKEDIESAIDDYTDEEGNVACYIDENGKTYLPTQVIEAIRQKLIEKGAYDTGEITVSSGIYRVQEVDYNADTLNWVNLTNLTKLNELTYIDSQGRTVTGLQFFIGTNSASAVDMADKFYAIPVGSSPYQTIGNYYIVAPDFPEYASGMTYMSLRGYRNGTYTTISTAFNLSKSTAEVIYNNETRIATYIGAMSIATQSTPGISVGSPIPYFNVRDTFGVGGSGGIDGVSVQESAILPTDTTKTLEEIYPNWANNKKTVKAVTVDENNNPQNIVDVDFLPATFKDVQGLNADSTQTQAQAQDGTEPTADDIVNALLPAIQEFYEKIKNSPDVPNPTIPAGDSGDTPPAEPPLISANANGLWDIYNPTLADVQSFGAWLWSSNIIDQITRMFASPIDAVIGFHMIYCTPIKGPSKNIVCGYLDSGVASTNTVANQYATIDCGTVTVPEYYGTVLDYTATKLALYLPFIGIVPLSTAVCMGASLQVIYRIDVLTGTCLAQVKVIKQNSDAVMYTFAGNCAVQIPLTATTYTGTVSALIGIANTAISVAMENPGGAIRGVKETIGGMVEGMGTGGVRQSGGLGSNAGALGIRIPYLIITHPAAYDAMRYNTQYGYPLNQTATLGDMSGYTRVKDIHLAGIPCTDDELEMIERLLKDGVIIN